MAKASEATEPVVKTDVGGGSERMTELEKRIDAMQAGFMAQVQAKDSQIQALQAQLETARLQLDSATKNTRSMFDEWKERLTKWEDAEKARLDRVHEELEAGPVQFMCSLENEPMMTRKVGTVTGSPNEAIAKYNGYFGRTNGPPPKCEPVGVLTA